MPADTRYNNSVLTPSSSHSTSDKVSISGIIFRKYQQVKTNDLMYYPLAKEIMPIMLLPILCLSSRQILSFPKMSCFLKSPDDRSSTLQSNDNLTDDHPETGKLFMMRDRMTWPPTDHKILSCHFISCLRPPLCACWTIWDLMVKPQFGGLNICHEVTSGTSWGDHSRKKIPHPN